MERNDREDASGNRLQPIHRRSLSDEVLDRLLEFIAASSTPTQQLLPEHALCERLGVSRSALREALSGLGHLGIVETRGKVRFGSAVAARAHIVRRAAVTGSPLESMQHALEARGVLEPPLARLAAERRTPDALMAIERFLHLMEEQPPNGVDLVIDYDSGFHISIARATGNPTLIHMVSAITHALAVTRVLSLHATGGYEISMAGHRAIFAAIRDGDREAAHAAMREHLADVTHLIELEETAVSRDPPRSGP
jgi:GntR family transcriptional repressor for pyruvate dehydrogenase complex